jgi:uncharacterized protein YozE (UPF0346 family)
VSESFFGLWDDSFHLWGDFLGLWGDFLDVWGEFLDVWEDYLDVWEDYLDVWEDYLVLRTVYRSSGRRLFLPSDWLCYLTGNRWCRAVDDYGMTRA